MSFSLPPDFLTGPAPNLQKRIIDWKKAELPEYDGLYAVVLDGVLSQEECDTFIKAAEATSGGAWEQAMVNVGNGNQKLYTDVRDCGRIIWDDRDMVAKLWARCKDRMSEIESLYEMPKVTGYGPFKRKETWQLTRPNERMRFLKYGEGQYFKRKSCDPRKSCEMVTDLEQLMLTAPMQHLGMKKSRSTPCISISTNPVLIHQKAPWKVARLHFIPIT